MPAADTRLKALGKVRWCRGTGTLSRSSQIRSPKTPFEAQLFVDRGLGKMRGFSHIHRNAAEIGMSAHQPIHTRVQDARTSRGKAVKCVQTLQGLE
jgi:hypothetical protein